MYHRGQHGALFCHSQLVKTDSFCKSKIWVLSDLNASMEAKTNHLKKQPKKINKLILSRLKKLNQFRYLFFLLIRFYGNTLSNE